MLNRLRKSPYFVVALYLLSSAVVLGAIGFAALQSPLVALLYIAAVPLFVLGCHDLFQTRQTIKRNFPIIGHFRYLFELIRPEIQQYFVESDTSGKPIPRVLRSIVYQRAKGALQSVPFGTQRNVYASGYEWANHTITPTHVSDEVCRVSVGSTQCQAPYSASLFNISAMSYGSLSKNAVLALNGGAKIGGFAQNTGEGGLTPYHLDPGGDVIWELGTGYFGARTKDGKFCENSFRDKASHPHVKMIEIKLSQGAKPGKGGVLPAPKVTPEIAAIRGVDEWKDCYSPANHTAFSTPVGLLEFVQKLRDLSNGKPVGFKLCIGYPHEFMAICKAMEKTGILPDYIVIDGGEGGTGAAPMELTDYVGTPLEEGLAFAVDCLNGFDFKKQVRVFAAGKTLTAFHILKKLALGADAAYAARSFMLSLGCIQALRCHTDHCPTGITTHNPHLMRGLVVTDKRERVARFHKETIHALAELSSALGLHHPAEVQRRHINRRISQTVVLTYEDIFPTMDAGCLKDEASVPMKYRQAWLESTAETFAPQQRPVRSRVAIAS